MSGFYLQEGLPRPQPNALDAPYWAGLLREELALQRCHDCGKFQWGPEWICHRCLSGELGYETVEPSGVVYSYERVWHPVHPALAGQGPYLVVLVELPHADGVRLVGNLLGDPLQDVRIGAKVTAAFERHGNAEPPFALLHWIAM